MSLVVVILFAVCWLPYHLYFLIIYLFPGTYIILFDFCGILVKIFKNLIKNTDNISSSISIRWSDLIKLYNFSASLIYELKSYFHNNLFLAMAENSWLEDIYLGVYLMAMSTALINPTVYYLMNRWRGHGRACSQPS